MTSILIITGQFWPEGSGGALATYLITKLLSTCGDFNITIVTGTRRPAKINNVNFIIEEGFRIRHKPMRWLYFLSPPVKRYYRNLMKRYDVIYIPYGYELIPASEGLDKKVIVHIHDFQPISYSPAMLHAQQDSLIHNIKAELLFELLDHSNYIRAIAGSLLTPTITFIKTWLSEVDNIICCAQRQAEMISSRIPALANKIKVVYNPLPETPSLDEKFRNSTFTYAGGGSYVKGFHIFMRGAINILKQWDDVRFLLAGNFKRRHKELVKRLNNIFAGRFKLLRHMPHKDILKLYSKSHATVIPSLCEEPLPYVVMEAMVMGTIPIASKIGGIPEIVKGTYAERLMFTPGCIEEMVDRMKTVIPLSREQLTDIGSKLRETTLKRFNNEVIKKQLLEIFNS
jgi:glycosyltransferase involved in cell wall biosynthesis